MDTSAAWERIEAILGAAPAACPASEVNVVEERVDDGLTFRKLLIATDPGDRCPAWLILPPARSGPAPAMLCLHQTTRCGKDEPAGFGGKADLHYARELAQRGYVTLAPDYPGFGEYRIDAYAMGYASASMKGLYNHQRALDALAAMPEVDANRLGVIGHSLGGFNALLAAARDPRLRLCVTSCGFTRFTWNDDEGRSVPGDLTDWSHAGYMPRIASQCGCRVERMPWDFEDILRLIAPRPLFINAPLRDFFRVEGVRECVDLTRDHFHDLQVVHPDCEHGFPAEVREVAYAYIDQYLQS